MSVIAHIKALENRSEKALQALTKPRQDLVACYSPLVPALQYFPKATLRRVHHLVFAQLRFLKNSLYHAMKNGRAFEVLLGGHPLLNATAIEIMNGNEDEVGFLQEAIRELKALNEQHSLDKAVEKAQNTMKICSKKITELKALNAVLFFDGNLLMVIVDYL